MLLFFLKFMTQNCGSYVTVQLLQTLNILFENIRNETSLCKYNLYFLWETFWNNFLIMTLINWQKVYEKMIVDFWQ